MRQVGIRYIAAVVEQVSRVPAPLTDRYDAIFFDNDGVLVDTEPLFLRATRELFTEQGIVFEDDDYREICLRQGRSMLDLAVARGVTAGEIDRLREQRNARYMELIDAGVPIFDGVADTLSHLHGELPLAIVTSSYRAHFERMHQQTGFLRFFDFFLAHGDYPRHKPHPDPYLAAAERLGVAPRRCLVIEDTVRGLRAAVAAGMTCVAVPTALSADGDFSAATEVLERLADLPSWLAA